MNIKLKKKLFMATLLINTVITVGCGVNNDKTVEEIENSMIEKIYLIFRILIIKI